MQDSHVYRLVLQEGSSHLKYSDFATCFLRQLLLNRLADPENITWTDIYGDLFNLDEGFVYSVIADTQKVNTSFNEDAKFLDHDLKSFEECFFCDFLSWLQDKLRFEKKGQQDKKLLPLVTKWRVYTKAFMASGLSGQYGRMFTFNCEIYINKDLNYE